MSMMRKEVKKAEETAEKEKSSCTIKIVSYLEWTAYQDREGRYTLEAPCWHRA